MFAIEILNEVNRPYPDKSNVNGLHKLSTFTHWLESTRTASGLPAFPVEAATLRERALNRRIVLLADQAGLTYAEARIIIANGYKVAVLDEAVVITQS